ncbi:hypothetical protein D3OALGA1CA_972 [Olavius algarvensis associated proteobacterium Delta 3]|nr:hypothetical protein D3OALGA1CA_972 [Olavius algarvensis associated proteobacterium Delta 3]CAB5130025.1 hypothetical protein D3OALGB2SA_3559 [Olavius algarvensis associated proteobacterium Delta 3]
MLMAVFCKTTAWTRTIWYYCKKLFYQRRSQISNAPQDHPPGRDRAPTESPPAGDPGRVTSVNGTVKIVADIGFSHSAETRLNSDKDFKLLI